LDRPTWIFCSPIMIAPRTETRKFVRTARRYRTIEIQTGTHAITAADRLPDALHHAIETITRAADVRTNLAQLGAADPVLVEPYIIGNNSQEERTQSG
jgi:hypothetical protein